MNDRLVPIQMGELLKYSTSTNAVERIAGSVFTFPRSPHPNDATTSARAQIIYDEIPTLAQQKDVPGSHEPATEGCSWFA